MCNIILENIAVYRSLVYYKSLHTLNYQVDSCYNCALNHLSYSMGISSSLNYYVAIEIAEEKNPCAAYVYVADEIIQGKESSEVSAVFGTFFGKSVMCRQKRSVYSNRYPFDHYNDAWKCKIFAPGPVCKNTRKKNSYQFSNRRCYF